MTRIRMAGMALIVVTSVGAGWFAGREWHDVRPPAEATSGQVPAPSTTVAPTAAPPDAVQLFSDGTVSVHVRRAQLAWLLDEVARQGGLVPGAGDGGAVERDGKVDGTPAAVVRADPEPVQAAPRERTQILQALREGAEADRLEALSEALANDIDVPGATLQQLVESDPSERVRLAAFKTYVDTKADDIGAVRALLDAGLYNPSPAVQAEARRRSDEFERAQRMQPLNDPQRQP